MSSTQEFLRAHLPSAPYYVIFLIQHAANIRRSNVGFTSIDHLCAWLVGNNDPTTNYYIAVANYAEMEGPKKISRKASNVKSFKSLVLDIDVGANDAGKTKPYATQREAIQALALFCKTTGIKIPTIINSGWGIHCWWGLDTEVPPIEWHALQHGLINVALAHNLKVDPAGSNKTTQVLRIPGTHNYRPKTRETRQVSLMVDVQPPLQLEATKDLLFNLGKNSNYVPLNFSPKQKEYTPIENQSFLLTNLNPAPYDAIEAGCAVVNWMVHNQRVVGYDAWWSLIGVAKYTQYPEQTAIRWSGQHPQFNESETLFKLAQHSYGPTLCTTLETAAGPDEAGVSRCIGCPHYNSDRVKTPVQIGARRKELETKPTKESGITLPEKLPNGYRFNEEGVSYISEGVENEVTQYVIWLEAVHMDQGINKEMVTLFWRTKADRAKYESLRIPTATLSLGNRSSKFYELLGDAGVTFSRPGEGDRCMRFLSQFKTDILDQAALRLTVPKANGWHGAGDERDYISHGNKLIVPANGVPQIKELPLGATRDLTQGLDKRGSLEEWKELGGILTKKDMHGHAFCLLAGFGAPLLRYSGLGGASAFLSGPSGLGKTTALRLANSVMGHPASQVLRGESTHNAIMHRLTRYPHFVATWDEVSNARGDVLSKMLYEVSGGQEKARLTSDIRQREVGEWSTIMLITSNPSLDSLLQTTRVDHHAELLRVIQLKFPDNNFFTVGDNKSIGHFHNLLANNYGVAAEHFLKALVLLNSNNEGWRRVQEGMRETLIKTFPNFSAMNQERFQVALVSAALYGGVIANKIKALDLDWYDPIAWALETIQNQRNARESFAHSPADLIARYVNEFSNGFFRIKESNTQPYPIILGDRLYGAPRGEFRISYVNEEINSAHLYILYQPLYAWCNAQAIDLNKLLVELANQRSLIAGRGRNPFTRLIEIARGTKHSGLRERAVTINLQSESFNSILNSFNNQPYNREIPDEQYAISRSP